MKILMISRPLLNSSPIRVNRDQAVVAREQLVQLMEAGILEKAFSIEGGGSVFVLNCLSQIQFVRVLREHALSLWSETFVCGINETAPNLLNLHSSNQA